MKQILTITMNVTPKISKLNNSKRNMDDVSIDDDDEEDDNPL